MAHAGLVSDAEWEAAARRSLGLSERAALRLEAARAAPVAGSDVAGFVGETLPVRVTVRVGGDGDATARTEVLSFFLKVIPRANAARARLAVSSRSFIKEVGLYEHVFPRMAAMLGGEGSWPRCFLARDGLLLMEDLQQRGFKALSNVAVLDEAHCVATLEALASLHASSIMLEESEGGAPLGQVYKENLQENMFTDAFFSYMNVYITTSIPGIKHLVGLIPKYRDSGRLQEILRKIDEVPAKSYELVKASSKYRNVVCHGDLWVGNVLFSYSPSGEVTRARLVDFQQSRYCPPALDIASFFFLSTRRSFREAHLDALCKSYHAALIRALPPAAAASFPWDAFKASCEEYAAFGRIIAACYLPCDLLPREVLSQFVATEDTYERYLTSDRSAIIDKQWKADPAFRDSVQEVIEELVDGFVLRSDVWKAVNGSVNDAKGE